MFGRYLLARKKYFQQFARRFRMNDCTFLHLARFCMCLFRQKEKRPRFLLRRRKLQNLKRSKQEASPTRFSLRRIQCCPKKNLRGSAKHTGRATLIIRRQPSGVFRRQRMCGRRGATGAREK